MFSKTGFGSFAAGVAAALLLGPMMPSHAAEDVKSDDAAAERAVVTARAALSRELQDATVDLSQLDVVSVKPHTWNSSALGCGPPRAMTTPVITDGFIVIFVLPSGVERRVHVAGSKAIVCAPTHVRGDPRIALPAAKIGKLSDQARADLAERLGVSVAEVTVEKFTPVRWANDALECPLPNEAPKASWVRGYRLQLRYRDQTFTYHTDYEHVRPCPAIDSR